MSKLKYNKLSLNSVVVTSVQNTINDVNSLQNNISSLPIPNDFVGNSLLNTLKDQVNEIKINLINIDNWLKDSNNSFIEFSNMVTNEINSIEKVEIKPRKNSIQ